MTVAELIARLSEMHQDMVVGIRDADTNWFLPISKIEVGEFEERLGFAVFVEGEYYDSQGRIN